MRAMLKTFVAVLFGAVLSLGAVGLNEAEAILKGSNYSGGVIGAPLLAPDGTVSAPGMAFASAPGVGWYISGGFLRSGASGTNTVVITATGIASGGDGASDLGLTTNHWKRLYMDYTNTGTVGAVTISKAAGRVNIAAAGSSVVVTNTLVTAASHVLANASTNDATCWVKSVVPAAGSFTLTTNANCTAQTSFDFLVISAD